MTKLEEINKIVFDGMALEKARAERRGFQKSGAMGMKWRHLGTGRDYYIEMTSIDEKKLEARVIYYSVDDINKPSSERDTWDRPIREFLDGRFRPL